MERWPAEKDESLCRAGKDVSQCYAVSHGVAHNEPRRLHRRRDRQARNAAIKAERPRIALTMHAAAIATVDTFPPCHMPEGKFFKISQTIQ